MNECICLFKIISTVYSTENHCTVSDAMIICTHDTMKFTIHNIWFNLTQLPQTNIKLRTNYDTMKYSFFFISPKNLFYSSVYYMASLR